MGLAEKRALKTFEEGYYKEFSKKISEILGAEVNIQVDWNSLAVDGQGHLLEDCLPKVFFEPMIAAIKKIGIDDFSKQAIRDGLKQIIIKNSNQFHNARGFEFKEGTLCLDHQPTVNVAHEVDFEARVEGIIKTLEGGL